MSEQEKKSGTAGAGGSIVMVEQTPESRHKLYRPTEIQQGCQEVPNIRSRAPAVALAASELLKSSTVNERRENEAALSSDKQEQNVTKKFSNKKRASSPESIPLTPLEVDIQKDESLVHPQSTPAQVKLDASDSRTSSLSLDKPAAETKDDENSITEDINEVKTPKVDKKHSDWSDEEQAGGLPRSNSRASRVSRTIQQLFCCGVRYEAPSEHNVSAREGYTSGI